MVDEKSVIHPTALCLAGLHLHRADKRSATGMTRLPGVTRQYLLALIFGRYKPVLNRSIQRANLG